MALVPEFISLLRDIRDNKYPSIVDMKNQILAWTEENREINSVVLGLYNQTVIIKDDTKDIYDDTVIYVTQSKVDIEAIKDATQVLHDNTQVIYVNTVELRDEVIELKSDTQKMYEEVVVLTEGLGFVIDSNGHMIVTAPDGSNLETIWIDVNGHMWVTLV